MASSKDIPTSALWFTAPRFAELRRERVPLPATDEVRVRAIASAPSAGTELLVYRGEVSQGMALDLPTLSGSFSFPVKYGYASVGEVMEAGEGVEGFSTGNLVFALHPHQSVFVAPVGVVIKLPSGLDPHVGLFYANLETAINIVHDSPLKLGETAVVFGQGVVGLLVTRLLRLAGAASVVTVDPLKERRELSMELGAGESVEPGEMAQESVARMSGGRGADVAIEVSGRGEALQAAIEAVAAEGTVVAASWYGSKKVGLDLGDHFHRGRVRIRSSQVGSISPELRARWDRRRRSNLVTALLEGERPSLRRLISRKIPFQEAPQYYGRLDRGEEDSLQAIFIHP